MSWQLGIDLGTTYTASAIHKENKASIFPLGQNSAAIPSVVFVKEDQDILVGDAAERRASSQPERIARGFKRRLGDETPMFLGGTPFQPEALQSELLKHVLDQACKRQGSAPDKVAICHPANWGDFKKDLLRETIRMAGLEPDAVLLLSEPEAAAISYGCNERMAMDENVVVYDLGGGTFDAAVLQRNSTGFDLLGKPEGIEHLGGVDFDAAVFAHVSKVVEDKLAELDPEDSAAITAVGRLKRDCTEAKEALSSDVDATIPVLLPNMMTEVRITRKEFEDLCRPAIQSTIQATRRAIQSADLSLAEVSKVLLVGGSSRIPLVSQMIQSELGRPLAIDTHPKHAIALGAAFKAGGAKLLESAAVPPSPPIETAPGQDAATNPSATATNNASNNASNNTSNNTDKSDDQQPVIPSALVGANIPDDPNISKKSGAVSQTHKAIPSAEESTPSPLPQGDTESNQSEQSQVSKSEDTADAQTTGSPDAQLAGGEHSLPSGRQPFRQGPAMPRGMDDRSDRDQRPDPKPRSDTKTSRGKNGARAALVALLATAAMATGAVALTRPPSNTPSTATTIVEDSPAAPAGADPAAPETKDQPAEQGSSGQQPGSRSGSRTRQRGSTTTGTTAPTPDCPDEENPDCPPICEGTPDDSPDCPPPTECPGGEEPPCPEPPINCPGDPGCPPPVNCPGDPKCPPVDPTPPPSPTPRPTEAPVPCRLIVNC